MNKTLLDWFSPPRFADDAQKTRTAHLLYLIIGFNMGVWLLALSGMPFTQQPLLGSGILLGLLAVGAAALWILRAGYVQSIAWGFTTFLWAASVILIAISGGITNPEVAGFLVVLMVAGTLSGIRATFFFGVLNLVAAALIAWLQQQGLLPSILQISPWVGFLIAFVNIALACGLLWITVQGWREALKNLEQARATLEERIAERTASLEVAHAQAESARVLAESARLQAEGARQALEIQSQQSEALVVLSAQLSGDQNVLVSSQYALDAVCRYLRAATGSLYLLEGDGLHLRSGYSVAHTDLPAYFAFGEGILGEVARRQQPQFFGGVTEHHLRIRSGTGSAPPTELAVYPLLEGGRTIGVLEIGLTAPLDSQQTTYFARAAATIAAHLSSALARQRITELLQETQMQAEELQAQEEELRIANEQLLARFSGVSHAVKEKTL